jgi:hypothetical protein
MEGKNAFYTRVALETVVPWTFEENSTSGNTLPPTTGHSALRPTGCAGSGTDERYMKKEMAVQSTVIETNQHVQ